MQAHETGEVHGNIRCHNVLVSGTEGGLTVKLSDPGLVELFNTKPVNDSINNFRSVCVAWSWSSFKMTSLYFSLPWLPPEDNHHTVYGDRYAFGITMWEIFKLRENIDQYNDMLGQVRV